MAEPAFVTEPLPIVIGDRDQAFGITVTDADGSPVDLRPFGTSVLMQLRQSPSSDVAATFTVPFVQDDDGDAARGRLVPVLPAAESATLSRGANVWDLRIMGDAGPITILRGLAQVSEPVSHV